MYNLAGKMLIAMPHMEDIRFRGGIVYIYQHNGEGTLGLMLNKVIEKPIFSLIIQKENIENLTDVNVPVVLGGPVETNKGFVLHTSDYMDSDTHVIDARYCITSGTDIIKAIVNGVGPR